MLLIGRATGGFGLFAFLVGLIELNDSGAMLGGTLSGLVIGRGAQLGDLAALALKRGAGVKDFSTRIPVAGGILDVYDGLIFAAPMVWLNLHAVGGVCEQPDVRSRLA